MNTHKLSIALLLLLTIGAAKSQQAYFSDFETHKKSDIDHVAQCYLACLRSGNDGVVESALAHIGRMALYLPDRRFPELEKEVNILALGAKSPRTKFRAYLISNVLGNTAAFVNESHMEFEGPDELFSALAGRLQTIFINPSQASRE